LIKTLVLYESRYGSTWEAAKLISLILGPSRRYPISQFADACRNFDFIIMGTPIYNGKIHPKMQDFVDKEKEWLNSKQIAIFCTCLNGSEGLGVLRRVEEDLGGDVLELGVLGGRLEMDRLNERDYQALKEYISREGLPPQGMDLFRQEEVIDLALRFKEIRDTFLNNLPVINLKEEVEDFLKSHTTCTLATSSPGRVRATPLEYIYNQGQIYILSEGGEKFANLLTSSHVSVAVYEDYTNMENLGGMQISGQGNIVDDLEEYKSVIKMKGMDMDFIRSLSVDLHLIRIDMEKVEFLNSEFEKQGYSARQILNF
jgi:flavodoxin